MTKIRHYLTLAVLTLLSSISLASRADGAIFIAEGVFEDGSALSGTVTIDTAAGLFTAVDLIVGPPSNLTFSENLDQGSFGPPLFYSVFVGNPAGTWDFYLGIELDSLVGYTGGPICSQETPACIPSVLFNLVIDDFGPELVRGSFSPVPEPATAVLAGSALAGLWAIRRRRRA